LAESLPFSLTVGPDDSGKRLDQFVVSQIADISRARVQQLIEEEKILVNGGAERTSRKVRAGDIVQIIGTPQRPPLKATPEDIPLDIVYEDDDLAVINKPAGMMVHAGAGATEHARTRGTLVNALLHRYKNLSSVGGELRPGIVHRLDRETSGLIVVAKNDVSHRKLAREFAERRAKKTYIALVHGWVKQDSGTIRSAISRDPVNRTRMTIHGHSGREAITHYRVQRRIESVYGKFSLLEVRIDTGRTHQIRVHLASLRHPVVGDATYGAPREIVPQRSSGQRAKTASLPRNFLHSTGLEIAHPASGEVLSFASPLPPELTRFLEMIEAA
jgi:23S rRNA pseudouridine1911/1915/1917 synthase